MKDDNRSGVVTQLDCCTAVYSIFTNLFEETNHEIRNGIIKDI